MAKQMICEACKAQGTLEDVEERGGHGTDM
jgi:hypothetical protein